ncbi:hypothetical protein EI42_03967 [Thermosporothrix hazakensis]|jgi:hypothetical protein|uniref:Uncharacterized protein n=1 Tax=Thermosporothrix hazakensis TaxID=644383 RepID=A0A326UCI5_THEHA|nr:hypothetical protein [Thermosporothrix hazakensis]PZW26386.1 hypothetical protein EI42_03967 [Thermosporothrix hazakensis]GCE48662.1 hypothetical protein KTH_35310 [Thermosporothrix hazakensis]
MEKIIYYTRLFLPQILCIGICSLLFYGYSLFWASIVQTYQLSTKWALSGWLLLVAIYLILGWFYSKFYAHHIIRPLYPHDAFKQRRTAYIGGMPFYVLLVLCLAAFVEAAFLETLRHILAGAFIGALIFGGAAAFYIATMRVHLVPSRSDNIYRLFRSERETSLNGITPYPYMQTYIDMQPENMPMLPPSSVEEPEKHLSEMPREAFESADSGVFSLDSEQAGSASAQQHEEMPREAFEDTSLDVVPTSPQTISQVEQEAFEPTSTDTLSFFDQPPEDKAGDEPESEVVPQEAFPPFEPEQLLEPSTEEPGAEMVPQEAFPSLEPAQLSETTTTVESAHEEAPQEEFPPFGLDKDEQEEDTAKHVAVPSPHKDR